MDSLRSAPLFSSLFSAIAAPNIIPFSRQSMPTSNQSHPCMISRNLLSYTSSKANSPIRGCPCKDATSEFAFPNSFAASPTRSIHNLFDLCRSSADPYGINLHHGNTYFLVAAITFFLTFSQVRLPSNISGIGSSSASSKYINPRREKESSETENFSL